MTVEPLQNTLPTTGLAPVRPATKRRWLAVTGLAAAFFVDQGEESALSLLWPAMHQALGASVGQLSLVLGVSKLATTLLLPVWGYVVDRYSRKRLLIWFTGIWGLWTLAIGWTDTLPQLLALRVLAGLGLGVFAPASFSLIGDLFPGEERGRAVGILRAVGIVGILSAIGALPALAGRSAEGWRLAFMVLGAASVGSALLLLLIREPARGAAEPELGDQADAALTRPSAWQRAAFQWRDLTTLAGIRTWRWLLVKSVLDAMSFGIFTRWAFIWLNGLGLTRSVVVVMSVIFVGSFSGHLLFGWLGDRLERRFPRQGRVLLVMAGLLAALPIALLFLSTDGKSFLWLTMLGLLWGLMQTATGDGVIWPIAQAVIPPELRGSAQAITMMVNGIAGALMLTFSGLLVDQVGVAAMLRLVIPIPTLITLFAWWSVYRTYPHDCQALHERLIQQRATLPATP